MDIVISYFIKEIKRKYKALCYLIKVLKSVIK